MADRHEVAVMARRLMTQHLDTSWSFAFDRAKRRSGACHFDRRVISLSQPIAEVASIDDMFHVMLHEIAHALVGPKHGHDSTWKKTAIGLGYDGRRLSSADVDARYAPYIGTCPRGHVIYRYRIPRRPTSCAQCSPIYDPKFQVTFARRTL